MKEKLILVGLNPDVYDLALVLLKLSGNWVNQKH